MDLSVCRKKSGMHQNLSYIISDMFFVFGLINTRRLLNERPISTTHYFKYPTEARPENQLNNGNNGTLHIYPFAFERA